MMEMKANDDWTGIWTCEQHPWMLWSGVYKGNNQ